MRSDSNPATVSWVSPSLGPYRGPGDIPKGHLCPSVLSPCPKPKGTPRTDRHGLDVVDRYQRRKYHIQQRERAFAELQRVVMSRAFLSRFLPLAAVVYAVVLLLTIYGVLR
jgi:hypothetical protein